MAALISGARTGWTQPVSMMTRPQRSASAGKTRICSAAAPSPLTRGAMSSMAAKGFNAGRSRSRGANRPRQAGQPQRSVEPVGIGQHSRERCTEQAFQQRPAIGLLDVRAGVVHQMHVVDTRRAGGHAGEAGEAAVDMLDHLGRGRLAALQHLLDEVNAASWAVELVAKQHVGRDRSRCRSRNGRSSSRWRSRPGHRDRPAVLE